MASEQSSPDSYRDRTYWLVYLYYYDPEEPMGFLWTPVGLVENRQTWKNWWKKVCNGEIELPGSYDADGWWVSDHPITFGLYGDEYAGGLQYEDTVADKSRGE